MNKAITRNIKTKKIEVTEYEYIEDKIETKKWLDREQLQIEKSELKEKLDDAIRTDDPDIHKLKSEYKKLSDTRKMLSENIRIMK